MTENEKLTKLCNDFRQLSDESKKCVLAITQALIFAQSTSQNTSLRHDESTEKTTSYNP